MRLGFYYKDRSVTDKGGYLDRVEEIASVNFTAYWCRQNGTDEEHPSGYSMELGELTADGIEWNYVGEYNLSSISYEDAKKNAEEFQYKMLTQGYATSHDLKHFIWD